MMPPSALIKTPKGQTRTQLEQPMQISRLNKTGWFGSGRYRDLVGQTEAQGASSHIWHCSGTGCFPIPRTWTRLAGLGDSTIASASAWDLDHRTAQASSQLWHPMHFPNSVTMMFIFPTLRQAHDAPFEPQIRK
jgi:hypothetical protein